MLVLDNSPLGSEDRKVLFQEFILSASHNLTAFTDCINTYQTRMHSSRMRTGRSLTVFRSLLFPGRGGLSGPGGGLPAWSGGVPAWSGGVPAWSRGVPVWSRGGVPGLGGGTCLVPGGCAWSGTPPPPVSRMTHTCKNITLAKTSFRPVKILLGLDSFLSK